MTDAQLRVDPGELVTAARDLDCLADRLEGTIPASVGGAAPIPAQGRDEVSVATAKSFTAVADAVGGDVRTGVHELRKIAAVLRAQASGLLRGDDDAAAALKH